MPDLWGYADLHCHPMAHLGFGGAGKGADSKRLFWGLPSGATPQALSCCDTGHSLFQGSGLISQIIDSGHGEGHGSYADWPRADTVIHQQMYVSWIRRAHASGLRLMCALAVNNELLASLYWGENNDNSDWTAIKAQVKGICALAHANESWMQIVKTPAEARAAIAADKLAVVLGIEVDSLGDWRTDDDCSNADVEALVDELYDELSIRTLTPIHLADNAFGGCAITNDSFCILNHHLSYVYTGADKGFYAIDEDASEAELEGVQFLLGYEEKNALLRRSYDAAFPKYMKKRGDGHVNARSLTSKGKVLLEKMMKRGMLIDVDHMSQHTIHAVLDRAEDVQYPLISSHTTFRELQVTRAARGPGKLHGVRNEGSLTRESVKRMRALGGILAPITHMGPVTKYVHPNQPLFPTDHDRRQDTSHSWAHAYLYGLELMGGDSIAIGTDFNGLAEQPRGRYTPERRHGPKVCVRYGKDKMVQLDQILWKRKIGNRKLNFNREGLVHYGLLPDFLRDVANQIAVEDLMEPFFRSAERFIQVWEKCEAVGQQL